ncbi:MAG: Rhs element Vgr protein, partial [Desulfonauticus sp. 38_4375]
MFFKKEKFKFTSKAVDEDTFYVISFWGKEGLSLLYQFEIHLISENENIKHEDIIKNRARFSIIREDGSKVNFNGVISSFEQLHQVDKYTFYKATLVPKLWYLTLTYHNQIFLNKTPIQLIEAILKDAGLFRNDYELKLQKKYPEYEFVCQYNETHFNFLNRWLEREGIYYYFDQSGDVEKIIFTDTKISHTAHPNGSTFYYSPPSGLDHEKRNEIIQSLICKYNNIPQRILLKDYNYMKPSLEISGSALVDKEGIGEVYYYGENFLTPEEGNRLAKIRAEQIRCTKKEFIGNSTIPYLAPGYLFTLDNHYREDFNQQYLTVEINHEGAQGGYLISGLSSTLSTQEKKVFYQNNFKAIPADIQFRAEKKTPAPKIVGTINAKIDAEGTGEYAELDDHGRYKVILPFDLSGKKDGKASTWIRMATPYAGSNHGMHFPLHKGTEVLITFVEGNPDRPVIAAAVPNPDTPSQVVNTDQTMSKITTAGGNKIHIEDKAGKQNIILHTPTQNTFIRLGAKKDEEEGHEDKNSKQKESSEHSGYGLKVYTEGPFEIKAGTKNEMIGGNVSEYILGKKSDIIIGMESKLVGGLHTLSVIGQASTTHIGGHNTYKSW